MSPGTPNSRQLCDYAIDLFSEAMRTQLIFRGDLPNSLDLGDNS